MDVSSRRVGSCTVVTASGEVDLYTSPRLREAVMGAVTDRSPSVVVDVSGVTYMDSSGIATLVEALKATEKRRGRLVLAGLTPRVREVFELARLQTVFTIVADVEAAVRAASGGPPA